MTSARSQRWWHFADRLGATASFLCAIHCALMPFVLALLPLLGLEFLADHRFERTFVLFAMTLASITLVTGYRRHGRRLPLMLLAPALVLLFSGIAVDLDTQVVLHSVLVTCGGCLLALAHVVNLRFMHALNHVHGPQCAH